jgi:hypothetical protein
LIPNNILEQRFLAKVREVASGCHEWQSTLHRQGYGKFWRDGRQELAHRVAYELFVGAIPVDTLVLHRCDNPRCVNPAHLFLGTHQDNTRDMLAKGRGVGRRKVSAEQLARIQRLLAFGRPQSAIAAEVGISQPTISKIKLGQRIYLSSTPMKGH